MTAARFFSVLALTLAGAGGLAGCQKPAQAQTNTAPAPTPFAAIADGKADVEGGIIQVAARSAGVVRDVYVQEGESVTKGQVLARQEDDAPRLAVATAEAALAQARAAMTLTETQHIAAQREVDRLRPLVAARYVSTQSVDQAEDVVRNADATLAAERATVGVAETQLNQARYALDQTIIRAPIDGKIVRRYAAPGVGASTLNVTPMFDLEPAGQRIVRAEVSEADEPFVTVGEQVKLVPEADQSKSYPGKVLRIAPVFGARKLQSDDPSQRTDDRVVEVVVDANGAPFLIGQRVLVKFMKAG
ncbi:MAG TPA: HlyD family efflux transporter periplasmic adaptor subunit [Caulobacteraceae bacterium]|nr:HlyD family efflux transporter periplasmic adaptor subunit [Caulobacteraceae bacterium]